MVDITGIGNQSVQSSRATERSQSTARSKEAKATSGGASTVSDSVELSEGAREGQTLNRLVGSAKSSPDVRAEAVSQAKQTLADGGFEGREVSRRAAENILDSI